MWFLPPYLLGVLIATLWPFNFWQENQASRNLQDGLRLVPPSMVYSAAPAHKLSEIEKFSIVMNLTSGSSGSNGYARILTYSLDEERMNFMIGQWEDCLVFLLKATGLPRRVHFEVEGVLKKGGRESLAIVFDGEKLSLYRSGEVIRTRKTGPLDFSTWDKGFPLVIGSEANGKFPWEGQIHSIAIFDRALSVEELRSFGDREGETGHGLDSPLVYYRFADGQGPTVRDQGKGTAADLVIPKYFAPYKRSVLTKAATEFRNLWSNRKDILLNILLFIPLGFLLAGYLNSRGFAPSYAILLTIALGFSLSLAIEFVQVFLPTRNSDLMDLISNTAGTIGGSILSQAQGSRYKAQGFRLPV